MGCNIFLSLLAVRLQSSCKDGLKIRRRGGRGRNLRHSEVEGAGWMLKGEQEGRRESAKGADSPPLGYALRGCVRVRYTAASATCSIVICDNRQPEARGNDVAPALAPGQCRYRNRTPMTKSLSKHLMFCVRVRAAGGEDREAVSLPVVLWRTVALEPLHHQPETHRRMRYQNDRGALSQLHRLLVRDCRLGWRARCRECQAVEGECSPVMTPRRGGPPPIQELLIPL